MIVKTIVHGLIAAGVIAGAGMIWTEVSYAQSSGYTATPNADGSYSWGPSTPQGAGSDTGYVEDGAASGVGGRDDDGYGDRDRDRDDDGYGQRDDDRGGDDGRDRDHDDHGDDHGGDHDGGDNDGDGGDDD